MRLLRTALMLCALLLLVPAGAAPPQLRVAYFELPGHGEARADERGRQGAALAYFDLIAAEMGVQPVYKLQPLPRLLQRQDYDLVLYLGRTPERERVLAFAPTAFFHMQGVLAVRADSNLVRIRGIDDLLPLTIGVWGDGYRSPLLRDPRLRLEALVGARVVERNLAKLRRGRIQGYYSPDADSLRQVLARQSGGVDIRLLALPEAPQALHAAFSASGRTWLPAYEAALRTVQRQRPYALFFSDYQAR